MKDLCKACEVQGILTGGTLHFVDKMDHAIVGLAVRSGRPCVVYDRAQVLDAIMGDGQLTYSEAEEIMTNRIEGVGVGRSTPVFIVPCMAKHIHMAVDCGISDAD